MGRRTKWSSRHEHWRTQWHLFISRSRINCSTNSSLLILNISQTFHTHSQTARLLNIMVCLREMSSTRQQPNNASEWVQRRRLGKSVIYYHRIYSIARASNDATTARAQRVRAGEIMKWMWRRAKQLSFVINYAVMKVIENWLFKALTRMNH